MRVVMRKGFAMIDLILAISLIGLLFYSFILLNQSETIKRTHYEEQARLQTLSTGLEEAFDDIVDTYSNRLANVADATTTWGWNLENTVSPFPILASHSGTPVLRFNLSNSIGVAQLNSLKSRIVSYFSNGCQDWTAKVGAGISDVYLYCKGVTNITYDLSDGTVGLNRAFALGSPIDPSKVPTAVITYAQEDGAGNFYQNITYEVGYGKVFEKRQAITANRLSGIRSAMENFTNATKLREIANPQNNDGSGGLNNADDEFVGWHWKIFGDDANLIRTTFCNKGAGVASCTNLIGNNIWRAGNNIARGLISRRVVNNLLDGDTSFYIDGFGNGIYIYPTSLQCAGVDYMLCSINALPTPIDDSISALSPNIPPFTSIIYTEPFKLKATNGRVFGRTIVTY